VAYLEPDDPAYVDTALHLDDLALELVPAPPLHIHQSPDATPPPTFDAPSCYGGGAGLDGLGVDFESDGSEGDVIDVVALHPQGQQPLEPRHSETWHNDMMEEAL